MSYLDMSSGQIVAQAPASERTTFLRRTYLHVAGAIAVFAALEAYFITSGIAASFMGILSSSGMSWFLVLAAFMGISYVADKWARSEVSPQMQYAGLGLFVVAEAIIFMPMLYIASTYAPDVIPQAGMATLALVAGLTFTAFSTKKDFSFLAPALAIGGMVALGLIVASMIFGFSLGLVFAGAMVLLAAGSILYTTSNMIHHYHTGQHVAASLSLFASVGMMFYYLVFFFMNLSGD